MALASNSNSCRRHRDCDDWEEEEKQLGHEPLSFVLPNQGWRKVLKFGWDNLFLRYFPHKKQSKKSLKNWGLRRGTETIRTEAKHRPGSTFLNQVGTQYVEVHLNKNSGSGQIFKNHNAVLLKFVYVSTKVFQTNTFYQPNNSSKCQSWAWAKHYYKMPEDVGFQTVVILDIYWYTFMP